MDIPQHHACFQENPAPGYFPRAEVSGLPQSQEDLKAPDTRLSLLDPDSIMALAALGTSPAPVDPGS
jgi:hypothetical protein